MDPKINEYEFSQKISTIFDSEYVVICSNAFCVKKILAKYYIQWLILFLCFHVYVYAFMSVYMHMFPYIYVYICIYVPICIRVFAFCIQFSCFVW